MIELNKIYNEDCLEGDEANANLYLAGVVDEDEDPDFNPFRKE